MRFRKSYICSNKLDVQETNCCFSQFKRIRNHFFGRKIEFDGLPALELVDLIVSVPVKESHVSDRSGRPDNDAHKRHRSQKKIDVMKDIDSVPSNVQSARQEAILYVCEDNEAVSKMIIKGRSFTMRHGSKFHRVALGLIFRSDQFVLQNPNQIHRQQKTNSQTS